MKRNEYDFSASCTSLEELLAAIGKLPSNITLINVQTSLCHFQPPSVELNYSDNLVNECESILLKTITPEEQTQWGKVTNFDLYSYYGGRKDSDAYYIRLSSKESTKFGNDMSSGKYGSLD